MRQNKRRSSCLESLRTVFPAVPCWSSRRRSAEESHHPNHDASLSSQQLNRDWEQHDNLGEDVDMRLDVAERTEIAEKQKMQACRMRTMNGVLVVSLAAFSHDARV